MNRRNFIGCTVGLGLLTMGVVNTLPNGAKVGISKDTTIKKQSPEITEPYDSIEFIVKCSYMHSPLLVGDIILLTVGSYKGNFKVISCVEQKDPDYYKIEAVPLLDKELTNESN